MDIKECKTVCLALGPYRNLTTLTAATLFLHPNCQVLNHAGDRIYKNKEINFFSNYNKRKFNHFLQYAIEISSTGKRGKYGGSITHAHAFDEKYDMSKVFQKTKQPLRKKTINSFFWKESLQTSNYIRDNNIDLQQILKDETRLRFLMPIRNPLDCAKSNLLTGHIHRFKNIGKVPTMRDAIQAVVDEIYWFAQYKEQFPNQFFYYFEYNISHNMLEELASFLQLDHDEEWLTNAQTVMVSKSNYEHDNQLIDFYQKIVKKQFVNMPTLKNELLLFF